MRLVIALAVLGGCGARIIGTSDDAAGVDAAGLDAAGRGPDGGGGGIDAAFDAAPCTAGDMRTTAPDGSCLMLVLAAVSYVDAKATCARLGAHLAILTTAALDGAAEQLVGVDTFIGLSDELVEGSFVWGDGTPLQFSRWELGEPNDGNGRAAEDCAIIAGQRPEKGWDDRPCAPSSDTTGGLYASLCQR
jgi:hypothetical protein